MKKTTVILSLLITSLVGYAQENKSELILKDGWKMQSSLSFNATGKQISQMDFDPQRWYNVSVPTTIIAGLLENKKYDFDPFYSNNLEKISGPEFDKPWWFRKEFKLKASEKDKNVILKLHGINYKANLWFNGVLLADSASIKGPFRFFEFDITKLIKFEGTNVLALEITRPFNPNKSDGDLAIDYADWIHYPADYNGGIVNNVTISLYDKVAVRYPLVTTKFDYPSLETAHLEVDAEAVNYSDDELDIEIKGKINGDIHLEQKVHLGPKEIKQVTFSSNDYPQLNVKSPKIWWPWQYGKPELNHISLEAIYNQKVSNEVAENFGIREIKSAFISDDSREFIINGKPIMLRGGAWSPDIFQRRSKEDQEQKIKLVRDMNMNIIRSEGKFEDDNFYDLCDKYGMLVMTGWMCCGTWQSPGKWDAAERNVAMESGKTMMYWLRNKACILTWLNGSDMPPKDASVERDWLKIESDLKWPNPVLATADASESKVSGKSGVKMNGPYDWVPPIYWETDPHEYGGAWSFATEISPGPSIPPYESLIKFIPKDSLQINSSDWLYHCGTMQFGNTNIFNSALDGRYGKSSSIKQFLAKAQAQNYEGHRAMMEAFGLNKYNTATGIVQWMLNNPWPGIIWHTFDYYLYPAGTYFGIKKSLEPLHIQYSYKSKEVVIVNTLLKNFSDLTVHADIYNPDGSHKYSKSVSANVREDSIKRCFTIPATEGLSDTYFLRLRLNEESGKTKSINWYWLSNKDDAPNWDKSKWYYTPQSGYTDFSALQQLPQTTLETKYTTETEDGKTVHKITVTNTGKAVAFFVHIRALKEKNGEDILPVIFDDNYLLLAPGESRAIHCIYEHKHAHNAVPYILISAWNLDPVHSSMEGHGGFEKEME